MYHIIYGKYLMCLLLNTYIYCSALDVGKNSFNIMRIRRSFELAFEQLTSQSLPSRSAKEAVYETITLIIPSAKEAVYETITLIIPSAKEAVYETLTLIPTQGAKRRKEVLSRGYLEVCMYVRNKRRRHYHQIVTKFLFKKNQKKYRIKLQLLT